MFLKPQQLHFTGIGGIGMSGIAEILLNLGYQITGSDVKLSPITERLQSLGRQIYEGHAAANVDGAKALVVTSAVEVRQSRGAGSAAARDSGDSARRTAGRADAAEVRHRRRRQPRQDDDHVDGRDDSDARGARSDGGGRRPCRHDGRLECAAWEANFLVVESDESDGSFLKLSPILAIVTNIDREHLDHYKDIEEIRAAFIEFVNKVPFYGAAIVCLDDENIQQILPERQAPHHHVRTGAQAMLVVTHASCGHLSSAFQLRIAGEDLGEFHLAVPGAHNVLNATAAVAIGLELEIPPM